MKRLLIYTMALFLMFSCGELIGSDSILNMIQALIYRRTVKGGHTFTMILTG